MTITPRALLARARAAGVDRLDAQLLLAHQLGRSRTWLLAHEDEALDAHLDAAAVAAAAAAFDAAVARRAAGVPLAYLTGGREFRGLALTVTPDVLVPRPETELLVDWALELLTPDHRSAVDLGTGSGAIALALKHAAPHLRLTATDASEAALGVAGANGRQLGLDVEWRAGDWWEPLAGRRFDLALANPPYIAAGDPHLVALAHEPAGALTPGGDGLQALVRIVAGAAAHLNAGGWLLLEHGFDQAGAVRAQLRAAGFEAVQTRHDLAGHARATGGCRPA